MAPPLSSPAGVVSPPLFWQCRNHQRPANRPPPLPGGLPASAPVLAVPGGTGCGAPIPGAPVPPRRPPLMRVSGRSIVAPLCLPRFSGSAQNLPWKPKPAAAPGNPQAQLGNANINANSCAVFQGLESCPWATSVPRPLVSPAVGIGKASGRE